MIRREKGPKVNTNAFGDDFEIKASLPNNDYDGHRIMSSFEFGNHQFLIRFKVDCVAENQENLNETLSYIQDGVFKPKTPVEITTSSRFIKKKWAQMFFSQTAYLVTGSHSKGKSQPVNTQPVLGKLNNLLEKIKEIVNSKFIPSFLKLIFYSILCYENLEFVFP
ncbi:hypothetical protein BpHYR1_039486 [Brachionus plicatilis]|uniref:Uncharacterized protein n=1 Tax=Brachionus plicatilis TaxID=10195 RepID=A0A3M7PC70_BRAPC|nr:hypothetical protein BpHYR1_039486 [Brachionus plicatilis]